MRAVPTCAPSLPARAEEGRRSRPQPAGAEPVAAARDEAALVRAARGLNHGEVRHGHVNLLAIFNQLG